MQPVKGGCWAKEKFLRKKVKSRTTRHLYSRKFFEKSGDVLGFS